MNYSSAAAHPVPQVDQPAPWAALWALLIGFFMILLDSTIVNIANPAIMKGLNLGNDYDLVIWVTSAYLLAYAVPLLVTGRLGDRFGPRRIYLIGLVIFTLASAWCGFAGVMPYGGIGMLIAARLVQGLGASMMAPQTMAIITRIFPQAHRGTALGIWGAAAGLSTLIGPLLGGVLVDTLGWEYIFYVNVPIGIVGVILAARLVPTLETHEHRFDLLGVALSSVGVFLLVFGLQEGQTYDWGTITGPISVWSLIVGGVLFLGLFIFWQTRNTHEPLLPLVLLRDRNFSLSNVTISAIGVAIVSVSLPVIFYFQTVRGLTPTQSALMLAPSAVLTMIAAPLVGRIINRVNPRNIIAVGLLLASAGVLSYSALMTPDIDILWLLLPNAVMGLGLACVWGPLSNTATRNLPPRWIGAGSGLFNTTRQIGSVLGSAAIASLITSRLAANLPAAPGGMNGGGDAPSGALPAFLQPGFAKAMSEAILLPVGGMVVAFVAVLFLIKPTANAGPAGAPRGEPEMVNSGA